MAGVQVLIYSALGFEVPKFGHVSLILAPDHSKLSKRHGAASVGDFEREGYLPQAMVNFLALVGWNDGTEKETFSKEELIQAFSLDRCCSWHVALVQPPQRLLCKAPDMCLTVRFAKCLQPRSIQCSCPWHLSG